MKIRKATKKDFEIIADIEYSSNYYWRMNKEDEIKLAKRILESKNSQTYILEDKKPVGYFVIRIRNKTCYIDFFAVVKISQKIGLGSKMMKKIILTAKSRGCKKIEVTVWAKNFPAIGFYNKFGFYVKDIKRKHYPNGDDKLKMFKELKC